MPQFPLPSGGIGDSQSIIDAGYPLPNGGVWSTEAADVSVSLTGVGLTASFGGMTANTEVAMTGIGVTASFGTLTPVSSIALSGNGVAVSFGSMTPSGDIVVALQGWEVGVSFGRVLLPPVFYDMEWATQPAWLTRTLPSYLYIQYNDDDDLQAFVDAYNTLQQTLLDWFISIQLPIYTGPLIVGALLDWVAEGLYGQMRPTLPSGFNRNLGPYNTAEFNLLVFNGMDTVESTEFYATTDDVFKRIITWNFYKGDGRTFSVRWLKRRVMRFLIGENGTDPGIDQTYQVSVGFGTGNTVDIRILTGLRSIVGGSVFNLHGFNEQPFGSLVTSFEQYTPLEFAPIFKAAVQAGALQLPFQYDWVVTV